MAKNDEVEKVATEMYSRCYIGHLPWEHWRKLAKFCIEFAERKKDAGDCVAKHKHRWSKQYHNIFNSPVRVCIAGRCGAIRHSDGHIVIVQERKVTNGKS